MSANSLLLVGVGGLGGEVLYALSRAQCPVASICIVDPDTISPHTISRHPLYTDLSLVGRSKAQTAAFFCSLNFPSSLKIEWFQRSIEEFPLSFFSLFDIIVCAVDNVDSRRFLNCALVQQKAKPTQRMIEGGSEGYMGHARCILKNAPCLECHLGLYASRPDLKPQCAAVSSNANSADNILTTAPFVNAAIAGLMLRLIEDASCRDGHGHAIFFFNLETAYMQKVWLERDPRCVVCSAEYCDNE